MKCKFVVGQKVVCVNDDAKAFGRNVKLDGLTKGEIYTITEIYTNNKGLIGLVLKEIVRSKREGYRYERFAPLKEKKTDISTFTEILNKVNGNNHDNDYGFNLDELFETVEK